MDEILSTSMQDAGFTTGNAEKIIIKAVGVGGGGCNAVNHMYRQNIPNVSFALINTDARALNKLQVPTRLQIGPGLGAGGKPEVAHDFAVEFEKEISQLFDDDTRMVFITAGMGGGTGTGAAPVVARIARDRELLTIGIVTIPFLFEGEKKILKALDGAQEMSKYVDAMLVINNQRLNDIYPDINMLNAFGKADDTLTRAASSIAELINAENPHINLDFNDVDSTLRNGGAAIISTGFGEGSGRLTNAIKDALNSPLLKNRDIQSSKRLLFNIFFNPDSEEPFLMQETNELTEFISSIDADVEVIWGMALDRSLGNKVKITILASGFEVTLESMRSHRGEGGLRTIGFDKEQKDDQKEKDINRRATLEAEYGSDAIKRMEDERTRSRYIVLTPAQMDNDAFIEAFEKSPTHNREKKKAEEIRVIGNNRMPSASQPATTTAPTPEKPDTTGSTPRQNTIHF